MIRLLVLTGSSSLMFYFSVCVPCAVETRIIGCRIRGLLPAIMGGAGGDFFIAVILASLLRTEIIFARPLIMQVSGVIMNFLFNVISSGVFLISDEIPGNFNFSSIAVTMDAWRS